MSIFGFFWARDSSLGLGSWQMACGLFLTSEPSSVHEWTLFTVALFFCLLSFPGEQPRITYVLLDGFYSGSVVLSTRSFWTALALVLMSCNPQSGKNVIYCSTFEQEKSSFGYYSKYSCTRRSAWFNLLAWVTINYLQQSYEKHCKVS